MKAEEFLDSLGIKSDGDYSLDDSYVVDIDNEDMYSKTYSTLEKSTEVEQNEDSSTVTFDNANIQYQSDEFLINLIADWNQNTYKLVCKEV